MPYCHKDSHCRNIPTFYKISKYKTALIISKQSVYNVFEKSQTCEQRSCKGETGHGLYRQVVFIRRLYCSISEGLSKCDLYVKDGLYLYLEMVFNTALTVYIITLSTVWFVFLNLYRKFNQRRKVHSESYNLIGKK